MSLLSIVIETMNAEAESDVELAVIIQKIEEQSYPQEKIEILVVLDEKNVELKNFLKEKYPKCKLILIKDPSYYNMKYYGLQAASGDVIALLDSDCLPVNTWAESIIQTVENGADFIAGKTRYDNTSWFAHIFNLFCFGHLINNEKGEGNSFIANNAAFKKEVVAQLTYEGKRRRYFGAHLITHQLKSKGFKLVYNPKQSVIHHNHGLYHHLAMRLRCGFEAIILRRDDKKGLLPERRFLKLGILSPFVFAYRRLMHDFRCILRNNKDLNISRLEIPIFLLAAIIIRGIEIIPGLITIISPTYLGKKYNW